MSQDLDDRPDHRPGSVRALDGAQAGLNVVVIVGARAEGVGWARARSQLLWTGELGVDPHWGMSAAVAVLVPCSVRHLLRPWTMCVSAASGQFGPKGTVCRYGMLHAQNAKSVLADVFQYLIVVCSMSKKSLFTWQIPRAEFRAPFQDPIRAGPVTVLGNLKGRQDGAWRRLSRPPRSLVRESRIEPPLALLSHNVQN